MKMAQSHMMNRIKATRRDALFYLTYLKHLAGIAKPRGYPRAPWRNAALKSCQEWERAVDQVKTLGLPVKRDLPKNWDNLAALDCILTRTDHTASILDAGAGQVSVILPWLLMYGYENLIGIDLVFDRLVKRGPIRYEPGDITRTRFEENTFHAVACLSVIEHGVDLRAYFREMARILKPNGVLITSTDYCAHPVDTGGQTAYGVPIHIFTRDEITCALDIASEFGLQLPDSIDLDHHENPVRWKKFVQDYTFLTFTLQKRCE